MSDFFPPLPEDRPPSPPPAPPSQPPTSSSNKTLTDSMTSEPAPPNEAPPKLPSPPPPPQSKLTQSYSNQDSNQAEDTVIKEKKKNDEFTSEEEQEGGEGDGEGEGEPETFERVVLKELNKHFHVILPSGWVEIRHFSGMNVYLHRESRVCTMSMPYHIGKESARRHNVPLAAIPCFAYKRGLEKRDQPNAEDSCPVAKKSKMEEKNQDECQGELVKTEDKNQEDVTETAGSVDVTVRVHSADEYNKTLTHDELLEYCEKVFEFERIKTRRFKSWKKRRIDLKSSRYANMTPGTKLISCVAPNGKRKEFTINPTGKTHIALLHEFVQLSMGEAPQIQFTERSNSALPYAANVYIKGTCYGTGYAATKKQAKLEAAKVTLQALAPEISKVTDEDKKDKLNDVELFDEISITDSRVHEICQRTGTPDPVQLLTFSVDASYGFSHGKIDTQYHSAHGQKNSLTMTVGKFSAKIFYKKKKVGQQLAAQEILRQMHPQIRFYGGLLRLYGNCKKHVEESRIRSEEMKQLNILDSVDPKKNAHEKILEKLRTDMLALSDKRKDDLPANSFYLEDNCLKGGYNVSSFNTLKDN
ncbi:DgyrCDS8921 [Dimorphilus gyrociliatus]|uniref:DgyrCDS8921 n=1 Tax=Dimorphilus gyrociliatus TaxID=2664684 RepID=A0A7I8VXT0_9ANNE|nr:DgyrCDS8921 [Dimorphilus gyrociliatus]